MVNCKWMQDEFCANDACPMCADYCPVAQYEGVCKYEDRRNNKPLSDAEWYFRQWQDGDKEWFVTYQRLRHLYNIRSDAASDELFLMLGDLTDAVRDWEQAVARDGFHLDPIPLPELMKISKCGIRIRKEGEKYVREEEDSL